ncbi:MAG: hypothetical protein WCH39_01680 [Schlesneria sp.]
MAFTVGFINETAQSTVENDGRVVSRYTQVMLYRDTGTRPTAATIASNIGIIPGSPFAQDTNATCYDMQIGPAPEPTRPPALGYHVTFMWATNAPLPITNSTDPTTRRTIWSVRPQIQQRFVTKDQNSKLIVNTAGQPFDGGIPIDVRLGTVHATRNVTATGYNKNTVMARSGRINSVTFLGGAPGTVQVDVETHEKYEGSYHFWEEAYSFTYDPLGMQPSIASTGFFQRDAVGSNNLIRIQVAGEDTMEPEPLDTNGIWVPIANRPASCAFVTPTTFATEDFNSYGL